MPVYLRRYYINKISDIHKKQEDAQQGKSEEDKVVETFENHLITWKDYKRLKRYDRIHVLEQRLAKTVIRVHIHIHS